MYKINIFSWFGYELIDRFLSLSLYIYIYTHTGLHERIYSMKEMVREKFKFWIVILIIFCLMLLFPKKDFIFNNFFFKSYIIKQINSNICIKSIQYILCIFCKNYTSNDLKMKYLRKYKTLYIYIYIYIWGYLQIFR